MTQNRSTAVMQRRVEAHDSLDDYPTPPWATRAMLENVVMPLYAHTPEIARMRMKKMHVQEPAANRGYMARPLAEYFAEVYASDVHDYGAGYPVSDYLMFGGGIAAQWTITNPPFRLATEFIEHSFRNPLWGGTAVIVRSAFLEGGDRYDRLFSKRPPQIIAQHCERVIMTKGIVRDPAKEYWDEVAQKMRRPSTATAYCWLIWTDLMPNNHTTQFRWIPPCRKAFEREGDYPCC